MGGRPGRLFVSLLRVKKQTGAGRTHAEPVLPNRRGEGCQGKKGREGNKQRPRTGMANAQAPGRRYSSFRRGGRGRGQLIQGRHHRNRPPGRMAAGVRRGQLIQGRLRRACVARHPSLSRRRAATKSPSGEVAERLKAPHSKCGILARVSGVRIPPSPPIHFEISVECWGLIEQPPVSPPRGIAVRLTADLAISAISFCLACAGQHRLLTRWLRMCTTWLSADMSV